MIIPEEAARIRKLISDLQQDEFLPRKVYELAEVCEEMLDELQASYKDANNRPREYSIEDIHRAYLDGQSGYRY